MSSTIRFIATRSSLSLIANLTLFVLMAFSSINGAWGQTAQSATDRTGSRPLTPLNKFNVEKTAPSPSTKLVDPQQFLTNRNLGGFQIQLSDSTPVENFRQEVSKQRVAVTARMNRQDQDRGTEEVAPKDLIEKIRQPLPDRPLQKLSAYPQPLGGPMKQFSKEPKLEEGKVQFPERSSREFFGQNKAAGPWVLEYDFTRNSPISEMADYRFSNGISWVNKYSTWASPNARSYPLYFEQINMERYGNQPKRFATALSAAHFFGTIPLVPYKMGNHLPRECRYTLGHFRPGSCNPSYRHRDPVTGRGLLSQALITGAVLGFLP